MNDIAVEAACWRIWYRLKEGPKTDVNLQANCGLSSDVLDEAIDALMNVGQLKEVWHDDGTDECTYALIDPDPRMMQVFPTLEVSLDE